MVEAKQLSFISFTHLVDIELFVEVETLYERVSHGDSSWFHGVVLIIVEFSDFVVEKVCHILGALRHSLLLYLSSLKLSDIRLKTI